jgi:hypothetical protein
MTEGEGQPEPYPLRGEECIRRWKHEHRPTDHEYQRVLFYIRRIMADPDSLICVVNHIAGGVPENSWVVENTNTQVSWMVYRSPPYDPQHRCVWLTGIGPAS